MGSEVVAQGVLHPISIPTMVVGPESLGQGQGQEGGGRRSWVKAPSLALFFFKGPLN